MNAPASARRLLAPLTALRDGLLDLLYPPKCLVCARLGNETLCSACREQFSVLTPPVCCRCGVAVREGGGSEGLLCAVCRRNPPYYFSAARAAGHFDGLLREAILRLKYERRRRLAPPLGAFVAQTLGNEPFASDSIDLLVPVPLHPSRLRERGFNQSELLAQALGEAWAVAVRPNALRRVRRTRPQSSLHASRRADNVRDAFAATDPSLLAGRVVLLVDDVITTLHTCNECARALTDGGARAVYVVAAARGG
jgi:ComF family protein